MMLCACLRNISRVSLKLKALDMLLVLGKALNDEMKLDRILPYLLHFTADESAIVRASGLRIASLLVRIYSERGTYFVNAVIGHIKSEHRRRRHLP